MYQAGGSPASRASAARARTRNGATGRTGCPWFGRVQSRTPARPEIWSKAPTGSPRRPRIVAAVPRASWATAPSSDGSSASRAGWPIRRPAKATPDEPPTDPMPGRWPWPSSVTVGAAAVAARSPHPPSGSWRFSSAHSSACPRSPWAIEVGSQCCVSGKWVCWRHSRFASATRTGSVHRSASSRAAARARSARPEASGGRQPPAGSIR